MTVLRFMSRSALSSSGFTVTEGKIGHDQALPTINASCRPLSSSHSTLASYFAEASNHYFSKVSHLQHSFSATDMS